MTEHERNVALTCWLILFSTVTICSYILGTYCHSQLLSWVCATEEREQFVVVFILFITFCPSVRSLREILEH